MRFSNDPAALESSRWEPLASEKAWPLDCQRDQVCTVFGQFADAANNESLVLAEHIRLEGVKVYLPMVVSNR